MKQNLQDTLNGRMPESSSKNDLQQKGWLKRVYRKLEDTFGKGLKNWEKRVGLKKRNCILLSIICLPVAYAIYLLVSAILILL